MTENLISLSSQSSPSDEPKSGSFTLPSDSDTMKSIDSKQIDRIVELSSDNISQTQGLKAVLDRQIVSFEEDPERHDHLLPPGWTCFYDRRSNAYRFEPRPAGEHDVYLNDIGQIQGARERLKRTSIVEQTVQTSRRPTLYSYECKYGYHFPESPTPSMISDLAKLVDKRAQAKSVPKQTPAQQLSEFRSAERQEGQLKRLQDMFPTATTPIIEQMVQIYQGREGLIKAALISLGYKRSVGYQSRPTDIQNAIMLMMAKPSSRKLFDKLVSYFPDRDENTIKNLMYEHREVEHEIISALVSSMDGSSRLGGRIKSQQASETRKERERNGAIMKLRYLRYLFPDCEEIELYHLLYRHDLKVQDVIAEIEGRGHKRANIDEAMKSRKSQQVSAKPTAKAPKDKDAAKKMVDSHTSRPRPRVDETRAKTLIENITTALSGEYHEDVIRVALQAADYNEDLAKRFLEQMGPISEEEYRKTYEMDGDIGPKVVLYPCKGLQKSTSSDFCSFTFDECVAIPREIVECQNALALLKCDASTWTNDDFEAVKKTCAKGKDPNLSHGSVFKILELRESLHQGSKGLNQKGSQYKQIVELDKRMAPNDIAKGPNRDLRKGPSDRLRLGHNSGLVKRIHPFFKMPERIRAA